MNPTEVEAIIREALPDARVEVSRARGSHDDDHLQALVVSPAFEGETLVAQHDRVYDALDGHMTTDIHALELSTYTPEAFAESDAAFADEG
jgi:stress-induced morphogen